MIASYFQDCGVLSAPSDSETTKVHTKAQSARQRAGPSVPAAAVLLLAIPLAAWAVIARPWQPDEAEPSLTAPLSLSREHVAPTGTAAADLQTTAPNTAVDPAVDRTAAADAPLSSSARPSLLVSLPVANADSPPIVPASPVADAARVRFAAFPWAEVVLEDGRRILTPQDDPVDLEPGTHVVVFEHPRFGRAEYTIDLEAGQQVTLRHVFEEVRP